MRCGYTIFSLGARESFNHVFRISRRKVDQVFDFLLVTKGRKKGSRLLNTCTLLFRSKREFRPFTLSLFFLFLPPGDERKEERIAEFPILALSYSGSIECSGHFLRLHSFCNFLSVNEGLLGLARYALRRR